MIESRCGILCGECSYQGQTGCKGCVNIEKPFWGERCPVKSCAETKGHEHCGRGITGNGWSNVNVGGKSRR